MSNLGLYIRASALVKILVLNDLYTRIRGLPGSIVEFGVWWGQNMVLFENLRAIHEPFNKTRRVVGFDNLAGYAGFSEKDPDSEIYKSELYAVKPEHKAYLEALLSAHESANVLGHISGNHELVLGDVTETAPGYFEARPGLVVALAYFDLGLYAPTLAALRAVKSHLIPGSVLLLDEFSWSEAAGEATAFLETFQGGYTIERSAFTPMRAIVTIT